MAVDSLGAKGQPQFDGTKASNTAADDNAIGDYAALVGNRVADTSGHRSAFASYFGFTPWEGLEYAETDTQYLYRYYQGAWKEVVLDGTITTAGTVNPAPGGDYVTWLRLAHRNVSFLLNVDPGSSGLSASTSNNLIGVIPPGFKPVGTLLKRAEIRVGSSVSGTDWARVRIDSTGAITVVYTTTSITAGSVLSLEASWPAA